MRTTALARVIEHAAAVVANTSELAAADAALADAVFRSVAVPSHVQLDHEQSGSLGDLPAGAFIADAIRRGQEVPGPTADLVAAVRDVMPELHWQRRVPGRSDPREFFDGHANAILIGPSGLEEARDVTVGVTLMAPHVRYPDHRHPPDEFYVALSPGQWRQGDGPWHEPGPGGVVSNSSGVVHSMRSRGVPLLALWFLRTPIVR